MNEIIKNYKELIIEVLEKEFNITNYQIDQNDDVVIKLKRNDCRQTETIKISCVKRKCDTKHKYSLNVIANERGLGHPNTSQFQPSEIKRILENFFHKNELPSKEMTLFDFM